MSELLGIIGGTGLTTLGTLEVKSREMVSTPFGEPSGPITHGELEGHRVVFLPRHGAAHTIPPHRVNYRANIWALHHIGVRRVIAVAAVGSLHKGIAPASLVLPDQIIDYTWGRCHTFFDEGLDQVVHIDFTNPYCPRLRGVLLQAAKEAGVVLRASATYGATQGPRLETAAEIRRMARDGCHLVGMTGMPEAALARELDLSYACCAVVSNWAAGMVAEEITLERMYRSLESGMAQVKRLLGRTIALA